MATTYEIVRSRFERAFDVLEVGADPVLRVSEHADYQANGVMALAKRLGRAPRDVAQDVVAALDLEGLADVSVAGPGFLNIVLTTPFLDERLRTLHSDERLGVERVTTRRVVLDYSAPNVAKEMHVGHLRSTVIGDALARMYRFAGCEVVARNHVGDWGTPFGMLIEHLVDLGEDQAIAALSIGDLDGFYKDARATFNDSDDFKDRSRARVVALQGGDPETLRLWHVLVHESIAYFSEVYAKLDVTLTPEDVVGESYYNERLQGVVDDLAAMGLLVESNGALCVFAPGFTNRDGEPLPLIVQKSDEGFGYAATDLAAVRDRVDRLGADEMIYVVGAPQVQHLEMVWAVARMAGWLPETVRCEQAVFGNVLGPDHKMFKSRSGESVKLVTLINEAIERAYLTLDERGTDLDGDAKLALAEQIARAAIKYADLSTERQHDYVFDLDRMVAFEGDTGPYLQYAHARVRSIFRRAGEVASRASTFSLAESAERDLALGLLALPEAFVSSLSTLQPHRLCTYLFDLAQRFTAFYDRCPVLASKGAIREERLALCDLTARTLKLGLGVLGIDAPEQM
ncbi:MAG TPA: arginine--tRNA ligase [Acidimicrobiales bacterium]